MPDTDPTVPQDGNRDGSEGHYSGQEAGSFTNPTPTTVAGGSTEGGTPATRRTGPGAGKAGDNLSPEAGHRATIDPATGEVHGSGAGAGGGAAGEDYDDTSAGGTGRG